MFSKRIFWYFLSLLPKRTRICSVLKRNQYVLAIQKMRLTQKRHFDIRLSYCCSEYLVPQWLAFLVHGAGLSEWRTHEFKQKIWKWNIRYAKLPINSVLVFTDLSVTKSDAAEYGGNFIPFSLCICLLESKCVMHRKLWAFEEFTYKNSLVGL